MNFLAVFLLAVVPHTGEMIESNQWTTVQGQGQSQDSIIPGPLAYGQCPGPNCPNPGPKKPSLVDKPWLPGRVVPELPTIHPNPSPKPEQPLVTPPTLIPLKPREQ